MRHHTLVGILVALGAQSATSWVTSAPPFRAQALPHCYKCVRRAHGKGREISMGAGLKGLAVKAKQNSVAQAQEALQASEPDSPVFTLLEQGKQPGGEKSSALTIALRKPPRTLAVMAEYRRKMQTGFITEILPPELISPMFRDGGAGAVTVAVDANTGGCTIDDMSQLLKEQSSAAGQFPGPLPVISHDLIVDEFQVAQAAALGCKGVTLSVGLVGPERCAELHQFATNIGLEPVVTVTDGDQVRAAGDMGATIIVVTGKLVEEAIELLEAMPSGCIKGVTVDRYSNEGWEEIEDCWELRDAGYNFIWVSEVLYKAGQFQSESVMAVIRAIRAKASTKYGRARGMSGRGEGAKVTELPSLLNIPQELSPQPHPEGKQPHLIPPARMSTPRCANAASACAPPLRALSIPTLLAPKFNSNFHLVLLPFPLLYRNTWVIWRTRAYDCSFWLHHRTGWHKALTSIGLQGQLELSRA
ncbi:unnamed protein product [Chrysoparadoxa australica]